MIFPYEETLQSYASTAATSRGRLYKEDESKTRSPYARDRDRVIHSSAFRRLKHKTQVFVYHEGDYYRTRLTHSIEVAQIARSVCRYLRLNEDLAECLALVHDFGHTAFGHAGEEALDKCMRDYGGFDHNVQTLRVVTELERRYAAFPGLNLTWETIEGLVKHNGRWSETPVDLANPPSSIHGPLLAYLRKQDLELHTFASLEAQIAAIADDIAYNNHDIDDGLRAGLFTLGDLREVPLVAEVLGAVEADHAAEDLNIRIHELVRHLISTMVADLTEEIKHRLDKINPEHPNDIRSADNCIATFSEDMQRKEKTLKTFLTERMYRHPKVNRMTSKGKRVVTELFNLYIDEPELLPLEWAHEVDGKRGEKTARVVADYIAGMTDRYAIREHRKLFDLDGIEI